MQQVHPTESGRSAPSERSVPVADADLGRSIAAESALVAKAIGAAKARVDDVVPVTGLRSGRAVQVVGVDLRLDRTITFPAGLPVPRYQPEGAAPLPLDQAFMTSVATGQHVRSLQVLVDLTDRRVVGFLAGVDG